LIITNKDRQFQRGIASCDEGKTFVSYDSHFIAGADLLGDGAVWAPMPGEVERAADQIAACGTGLWLGLTGIRAIFAPHPALLPLGTGMESG
jgi:hypothetical protein